MSTGRWGTLVLTLAAAAALRAEGTAEDPRARGEAFLAQGNWAEAEQALDKAVKGRPDDARAWGLLGTVRNALSKYTEGAAACEKALSLDAGNFRAQFDLGVALFNLNRSADAIPRFDAVMAADPKHADATWMRGHCALRANDLDRAATLFLKAAGLDARRYAALGPFYAGVASAIAGRKEEAIDRMRAAEKASSTGTVAVMAAAYRERLSDPTPCETLLRPEDYLPPREGICTARAIDAAIPVALADGVARKVTVQPDLSTTFTGRGAPLSTRAMLRGLDLAAVQAGITGRATSAWLASDPDGVDSVTVVFDSRDGAAARTLAPYERARETVWLLLIAIEESGKEREEAVKAALALHRGRVDDAMAAGVWGHLVEAMRRDEEERAYLGKAAGPRLTGTLAALAAGGMEGHKANAATLALVLTGSGAGAPAPDASTRYLRDAALAQEAGASSLASLLYGMCLLCEPERGDARVGRARALGHAGRVQAALGAFDAAGAAADLDAGLLLFLAGDLGKAAEVLAAQPASWQAWEALGLCHAYAGRWEEAISCLRKATEANPARAALHRFHIGLALHAKGDREAARKEWAECARIAPASAYGMLAQGLALTRVEMMTRRKAAVDAATAATEKLAKGWGAIAKIAAIPQHKPAGALLEWLEAARKRGGELGKALAAELTSDRRAACSDPMAAALLEEALRQAEDDGKAAAGEDAAEARCRVVLLNGMRRLLVSEKK